MLEAYDLGHDHLVVYLRLKIDELCTGTVKHKTRVTVRPCFNPQKIFPDVLKERVWLAE